MSLRRADVHRATLHCQRTPHVRFAATVSAQKNITSTMGCAVIIPTSRRRTIDIRSGGEVNDLIRRFLGEAMPSVDLAHGHLPGGRAGPRTAWWRLRRTANRSKFQCVTIPRAKCRSSARNGGAGAGHSTTKPRASLPLESLAVELQRAAILGHGPDELIRCAVRKPRLDLNRHCDLGAHLTGQMGDHLVGDAAGVAPDAVRVHLHRAMKAAKHLDGWRRG